LLKEDVRLETVDKFMIKPYKTVLFLWRLELNDCSKARNHFSDPSKAAPLPAPGHKPWPNVSGAPLAA